MTKTTIKNGNVSFTIESVNTLSDEVVKEIENIDLPIYWSDSGCKHYSFDTKLNNGSWLENIYFNNELDQATALIVKLN